MEMSSTAFASKACASDVVLPFTKNLVSPLQPANAPTLMLVTPSPMVMLVRPLQFSNAYSPMLVTESGIVTLVRPLQW